MASVAQQRHRPSRARPPFLDGRGLWQLIFDANKHYLQLDPGATDLPMPIKGIA